MITVWLPSTMGSSCPSIRPMSWWCGCQVTKSLVWSSAQLSRIMRRLAVMLAWLTLTPLGAEVEPEVYCKKATRCGSRSAGRANASGASQSSVGLSIASAAAGVPANACWSIACSLAATSSRRLPLSCRMLRQRSTRRRFGRLTGTAMRSAIRQARKLAIKSRPCGKNSATRSPGSLTACNWRAMALARPSNCW